MSIDLAQFHATFFEESLEALDAMEANLLELDAGGANPETINTIFRVAHSIKGGAGMFGFNDITRFTHTLETLLDELRSARRPLTPGAANALLQSVDVLRDMIGAVQHGTVADAPRAEALHATLQALVEGSEPGAAVAVAAMDAVEDTAAGSTPAGEDMPAVTTAAGAVPRWLIRFRPLQDLLTRGNDPARLFGELAGLGTLAVEADLSQLPPFATLDPEVCALRWTLTLDSSAPREAIELIFEWAEGDCELEITPQASSPIPVAPVPPAPRPEPAAVLSPAPAATPEPAAAMAVAPVPPTALHDAEAPAPTAAAARNADAGSIRVSIEKIDELLNTVGEIVITQSMLSQLAARIDGVAADRLKTGLAQLESNIRELQESVMRVRMLPVSFVFSRFPRLVRDLSQRLGKQIRLKMTGEQTELDKTVLEKIGDPLVHLVRNSIDHGIEMPEARVAAGKPAEGTVHLNAFHKGGSITLEVSDDGKGLDRSRILEKARSRGLVEPGAVLTEEQVNELIFLPGFSTAENTTDLSGRGVGMDVVRRNIKELGGTVELRSDPGQGTRFIINLPLTLAIVDGLSVAVGEETYIVPLVTIIESLQLRPGMASHIVDHGEVFQFRGDYLPVIRLHDVFGVEPRTRALHEGLVMVVEGDGRRVGLFVDALLGQQQVVIKSMESNYRRIDGVGGATILGEGMVALILDVPGLIRLVPAAQPARRIA